MDGSVMRITMLEGTREEALARLRAEFKAEHGAEREWWLLTGFGAGMTIAGVCWLLGMVVI
jgi:phage terminase large subunit-like protein